ncbi:hypothetical protein [Nocardia heshunensis]
MAGNIVPGLSVVTGVAAAVIGGVAAMEDGDSPEAALGAAAIDGLSTSYGGKAGGGIAGITKDARATKGFLRALKGAGVGRDLAGVGETVAATTGGDYLTNFIPGRGHDQAGDRGQNNQQQQAPGGPGTPPVPQKEMPVVNLSTLTSPYVYV